MIVTYSIEVEIKNPADTKKLEREFDEFETTLAEAGFTEFTAFQQVSDEDSMIPR